MPRAKKAKVEGAITAEKKPRVRKPRVSKKTTGKEKPIVEQPKIVKKVEQPEINIGMIGHVDHGKTSLTKSITGKWCDTHSEEVKRGISIRLGYADATFYKIMTKDGTKYSNNPQGGEVLSKRVVSFVDAPGHETLMTTMLSGAALMNGAVLVIAANEFCPQPMTIEHLMALKFAGIKKIVVAQNKIDLVSAEEAKAQYVDIKKLLKEYGYDDAPIIPTVANFGTNLDLLIEAIETHLATPSHDLTKPVKMFIARSFDINRPGTKIENMKGAILGGSITQGKVIIGDEIEIYPGLQGKTITKVVSISCEAGLINEAKPGGLVAIATELDPSLAQNDKFRGQIIAKPNSLPAPTKELNLKITIFQRPGQEKTEFKASESVVLTVGTNTLVGFLKKVTPTTIIVLLKQDAIVEKGEKIAVSKHINSQWRLTAYAEVI